ncbi:MAG: hypothetical protein ACK4X1_17005 [Terricaulis sp.]
MSETPQALPPEEVLSLQSAANNGDWRAAKRLALDRYWGHDLLDAETERLWRIWAAGEPAAHAGLAHLLATRCAVEDRVEAVHIMAWMIESDVAPELSANLDSNRQEYEAQLESGLPPPNCTAS